MNARSRDDVPIGTQDLDRSKLLALIDASRSINEELQPAEICQRVAEHAARVLEAEGSSVLLYEKDRNELVFYTVVGPETAKVVQSQRFPADKGIAGQVVRTGRATRVDDVRDNNNFYAGIDLITKTRTRNLLAVPLVHHDVLLGVVEVLNRKGGGMFSDEDLRLLQVFANLVAGAANNAEKFERIRTENRGFRESIPTPQFVGNSPSFTAALDLCRKVAPSTTSVLLMGETGTGKEMAARTIHALSRRSAQPFVAINCAALPEALIESELFGHEAGAFTGAVSRRLGRFELAHHGTLLLDEIGELEPAMQAKLLRVLETCEFMRVGGTELVHADVRIVAATNRHLKTDATEGRFREDLFYRLSVFPITIPPLRDRLDDLPLLVEHLMAQVIPSLNVPPTTMSAEALACMTRYHWPGNVRELRNVVERAVLLAEGEIRPEHLPSDVRGVATDATPFLAEPAEPRSALAEQEHRLIRAALEEHNWNQSAAARQLGISRDMLRHRVKLYGLRRPNG